jgi:hypothetical protein
MPVKDLFKGAKFTIVAWEENEICAVEQYIFQLIKDSNSDANAIVHLLERTANHGLTHNEQKIRRMGNSLIEFKARGGTRILGFICDENKIIVCSHGVPKLKDKRFQRELIKIETIKEAYEIEVLTEENLYVN